MSRQRSRSRSLAIQAIYQWQMAGQDVGAIISHFLLEQDAKKFDSDYFSELVRAVPARIDELDDAGDGDVVAIAGGCPQRIFLGEGRDAL